MKLGDYDFKEAEQEVQDFKNDVLTLLNFGKYQKQVVSSVPTWRGLRGEEVYLMNGTTGILYTCTSDNTATWRVVSTFVL